MEKVIDIQNDDHLPVMEIDLLTELQDDFKDSWQRVVSCIPGASCYAPLEKARLRVRGEHEPDGI